MRYKPLVKNLIPLTISALLWASPVGAADRIGETAREFREYCQGAERMRMCGDIIGAVYGAFLYGPTRAFGKDAPAAGCVPDDATMDEISIEIIGALRATKDAELLDIELPVAISDILFRRWPCS